jgi:hypothetical protein
MLKGIPGNENEECEMRNEKGKSRTLKPGTWNR